MRALKKVIAFVGSAAAAISLAASAMTAFAFQPVDLDDRASELKNGITNIIADEVYAEPGETVSYRVMIKNNKGYGPSGIALNYDAALTPVLEANGVKPALKWGDGSYGLTKSYSINQEKHLLGIGTSGTDNCEKDGVIYTAQFVVPADAKENTVYLRGNSGKAIVDNRSQHKQTFGRDIYNLLEDSFYIENYSMGKYALDYINRIINIMLDESHNYKELEIAKIETLVQRINLIGNDVVKNKLKTMLLQCTKDKKDYQIKLLKEKRDNLNRQIAELED